VAFQPRADGSERNQKRRDPKTTCFAMSWAHCTAARSLFNNVSLITSGVLSLHIREAAIEAAAHARAESSFKFSE
jgi:hypothetical protein